MIYNNYDNIIYIYNNNNNNILSNNNNDNIIIYSNDITIMCYILWYNNMTYTM